MVMHDRVGCEGLVVPYGLCTRTWVMVPLKPKKRRSGERMCVLQLCSQLG